MPNSPGPSTSAPELTIIGRSSSHFTRVARIFALELGLEAALRVVPDLASASASDYGGNPALRIPALVAPSGTWFGALSACRELQRQARSELRVIWPEALDRPLLANAQELTVQAMSSEVSLIMGSLNGSELPAAHREKLSTSLRGSLSWLDQQLDAVLDLLPARDLSFLEVTLFCLVTHLEFRPLLPVREYTRLQQFCSRFAQRSSARATPFRFDAG
ncbi:MAG TPA: glutathione S-transferase domain-containing protein [Polyangiaceae bacterium]|nr:glutathione S-transferase domain-containing protein [Polyangiaceae bacterium]